MYNRPMDDLRFKKRLVIFGTRHWQDHEVPDDISQILRFIIESVRPEVGLEEWCPQELNRTSAFKVQCDSVSPQLDWKNIGTPNTVEFRNDGDLLGNHAYINGYGPLDVQERRESAMCYNIHTVMSAYESGLLVVGEAHIHSMSVKLSLEFDVEPYGYFPPSSKPRRP